MKVEAYKSNNGSLWNTELEAEIEDKKVDLLKILELNQYPRPYVFSPVIIINLLMEHKDEVVKILTR